MSDAKTELVLVRHGETAWNAEGRVQGHLDIPLNPVGVSQANALGRRFRGESIHAIYSSDLDRAYATAGALAEHTGQPVHREPRLRERHLGVLQGLTRDEAISRQPAAWDVLKNRHPDALLEGGENLREFQRRITNFLADVCDRHAGERIVLVTHGGVLDAAYRHAVGMSLVLPRTFSVLNASVNLLTRAQDTWELGDWGDVRHLADEAASGLDY